MLCDIDPFSFLGSSVISGLGSWLSGLSQSKAIKEQNATNLRIANLTNQTNRDIADATNQMSLNAMRENNQFNAEQALKMFNLENQYNSPTAQKQRLISAGLNPATMYGNSATSAVSSASTPTASAVPSLTAATMQAPQVNAVPSPFQSIFSNIKDFASSMASVSSSKLSDVQKEQISLTMDAQLKNLLADANYKEANTEMQNLQIAFEKLFGAASRKASVRKDLSAAFSSIQQGLLAVQQGKTEEFKQKLTEAQTKLENTNNELITQQLPYLVQQAQHTADLIEAQVTTERGKPAVQASEMAANYGSANASNASADFSKALRITENITRWDKKKELQEAIHSQRFGRVVQLVDAYLKANGYNQPVWNLGAQFYDKLVQTLNNLSGDKNSVDEFRDWIDKYANDSNYYGK